MCSSLLRSTLLHLCLSIVIRVFPVLLLLVILSLPLILWVSFTAVTTFLGTHRFWLEVLMAAEVEKVQVCRVVPGWEERLVLFTWHCLALGPICHGRAAGMQRCSFCACLVLRETVGWESAPGSHHSLCMKLETKTRPARVGTGSIPWQTPFCAPQLSYEDLSVLTAEMEQIFHSLSKAISTDEPCSRQSSGSTGYIPVCSHTFPPHCWGWAGAQDQRTNCNHLD